MEGEEQESLVSTAQSNISCLRKAPGLLLPRPHCISGSALAQRAACPAAPLPKPASGGLWGTPGEEEVAHAASVVLAGQICKPASALPQSTSPCGADLFSGSACFQIGGVFVPCARPALDRLICLMQKNAVIESLQEQVSSAKEKLMRLMSAESGCNPHAPSAAPCTQSAGQHGDARGDRCPLDLERDGWQPPCLLGMPPLSSDAQDLQKHVSHEPVGSQTPLFDMRDGLECGLKEAREHGMPAGQEQPLEQLSGQDISAGVAWESSPKVSYVSSEKLREILQELSLDGKTYSPALPGVLPCSSQGPPGEQGGTWGVQEGYPGICTALSPYLARRRRRIPLPRASTCFRGHVSPCAGHGVKEVGGWGHGELARISLRREGEMTGGGLLHPPAPSPPAIPGEVCLQPEGWPGWPESQGASPCIPREQQWWREGALRGPAEPSLHSLYYYPDSDSSSSSSEEMFHGCNRPCCEVCFQSPCGSLGSSSTDTEPSGHAGHWTEHHSGLQPVVNFKEDLKPTFV